MPTIKYISGLSLGLVVIACNEAKGSSADAKPAAPQQTPTTAAFIPERGIGAKEKEALENDVAESRALVVAPLSSSHFQEVAEACHNVFKVTSLDGLSGLPKEQGVACWPSGRCESSVENVGQAINTRKIKFGDGTNTLEQAFLDVFQAKAQNALKAFEPNFSESERTLVWRDFMANTNEEKDLRDIYKVMALWATVSLKWLPCKNESGFACSVQPQVQFAMLAVTPQKNSAQGGSCTLFYGIPEETKAKGFAKPSDMMRQLRSSVRPALEAELKNLGVCGDNSVQNAFEECDDGNLTAGDGCSELCTKEVQ